MTLPHYASAKTVVSRVSGIRVKLMATVIILTCGLFFSSIASDSLRTRVDYRFLLQDDPARFCTMQQLTQNYLSAYGLLSRGLSVSVKNGKVADLVQMGLCAFYFLPMTHEEGHRTILTALDIGAVSQPYYNSDGFAYVNGVTDSTLRHLRDTGLPQYIRLHTAGLESDYMLTRRVETIGAFGFDDPVYYRWEYLFRKFMLVHYYMEGLFKVDADEPQEADELERDIVGFDTYGAARHLYRPTMDFRRYTSYDELTSEERRFIRRAGYRSLLNAVHPMLFGKSRFKVGEVIDWCAGAGYTMAPFGDFIDETVWLSIHDRYHCMLYLRQYENEKTWFPAFGAGLLRYRPVEHLSIDASGHFWRQPKNLSFRTREGFSGGALDIDCSWFFLYKTGDGTAARGISADIGFLYKTEGFMPEVMAMDESAQFRIGTTLRL